MEYNTLFSQTIDISGQLTKEGGAKFCKTLFKAEDCIYIHKFEEIVLPFCRTWIFLEATPNLLLCLDLSSILKGISSRTVHHHCWYPKGLIKLIFVGFCSYNETPIHTSEMYLR